MENTIRGIIEFRGVQYSRGLTRFVEKRIQSWINAWGQRWGNEALDARPEFRVSFIHVGQGHSVSTRIWIRLGSKNLRITRDTNDPHQGVIRCLGALQEV